LTKIFSDLKFAPNTIKFSSINGLYCYSLIEKSFHTMSLSEGMMIDERNNYFDRNHTKNEIIFHADAFSYKNDKIIH